MIKKRMQRTLNTLGYDNVIIPLHVLRKLYPLCRDSGFDVTVTLVHREFDWVITDVEAGDQSRHHYAPVTSDPGFLWSRELNMDFEGLVYIIPSASNYVGGDIVSGLLTLDIHKKEETSLLFDIGTNGELVIGNKDWMMAEMKAEIAAEKEKLKVLQ